MYIVFFLSCVLLIITVLLQPGKTDAGALFTSNISSSALNPRGTQSVLSKLTIAMAAIFMLSALLLSLPAITGKVSVLQTQGEGGPANTTEGAANTNADNTQNTAPANTANTQGATNASSNSEVKPAEENKAEAEGKE
ncbi:MAG TPA: preprotein translocase subunit SecG [Aridibacter sp.]|nr:preprotein translocase subunit SecG [Aridibacter sp.]